ncbi:MAG: DNA polymerase I [Candidatus Omnitrophica bacterium]|nr:DNA polymerase I [Candidatus Omnitrophota bacterium]
MHRKRLFLIDGNSFCYRAFFAIKSLSNSKAQPTNAIYGFVTMLNKIIEKEKPDYLAVAFDLKAPTFRHKLYEEYKIHRKPMPDELVVQIEPIKEILHAYKIKSFEKEGFEADDILATIAKGLSKNLLEIFIVTGDKDTLQLVNDRIRVYNTYKEGLVYDIETVRKNFGVEPSRIVDLMALMGDSSDNIPGIPGIGRKTAVSILKEFGSLDNLFSNLDKLKNERIRESIKKNRDRAMLSRTLATSNMEVPIEIELEEMRLREPDKERLFNLFKELEFKSLLKDFAPSYSTKEDLDYNLIDTRENFENFLKKLKGKKIFSFDFETTSQDPVQAEVVGLSFSFKNKEAYYIAILNKGKYLLEPDYIFHSLKDIFEDPNYRKIGQNIKYEKIILKNLGIDLKGIYFDTMVASYLINPSKPNHNLDDIAVEYLNTKITSIEELIGKEKKQLSMIEVGLEKIYRYGCQDADITFRLYGILKEHLKRYDLDELFYKVELPLIDVLAQMEINGVRLDTKLLRRLSSEMEETLKRLTNDIYEIAGCSFNINSPKQLAEVLFERLKLPTVKKTKTGYSTDVEVLEELAKAHSIAKALLEYRELSKLKTTYVDALPELINPKTGKVHTSFNQTVAQTGRLSSSNPNLQNIPIKTETGRRIRKAFIPEDNSNLLISADYSQIELRILAHLSEDETLMDAFKKDLDIHTHTASLIFNLKEEAVTPKMRDIAKTVNFGIVYGMSPYGLSRDLGIEPQKAKEFIDSYFNRYPRVRTYLDEQINLARRHGFVKTLFNRRRYIPDISSTNIQIRQFAERTAINTPIQGSAADLIKLAMIKVYEALMNKGLDCKPILQVHDELVFDCSREDVKRSGPIIKDIMENVIKLKIPIKVSLKSADNWLEA